MDIVHAVSELLHWQVRQGLQARDPQLLEALRGIADALDAAGTPAQRGRADPEDRLRGVRVRLTPPLDEQGPDEPADAAREIIEQARKQGGQGGEARPPGRPHSGDPAPGPAPGGPTPPVPGSDEGATGRPPAFASYRLQLELTKVTVVHVTTPRDDEDEFLLTGGFTHGSGGRGPFERQWEHEFNEGDPDFVFDPPLILRSVGVPIGTEQHFDATVILNEEDWASPALATALGVFISIVLTAGVLAGVNYLRLQGLPTDLTDQARDLLERHGITGVRSWFSELVGPELFEIPTLRATTNWPAPDAPVMWKSWISYQPGTVPSTPPQLVGPGVQVGQEVTFREARIANDDQGPRVTIVNDPGEYRATFQFRLVAAS